jgi:hypothetical protein
MSNIERLRVRLMPERREKIAAQAAVIIAEEQARLARRRGANRKRKTASQSLKRPAR